MGRGEKMGDQLLPPIVLQEQSSREGHFRLRVEGNCQAGDQLMKNIVLRDTARVFEEDEDGRKAQSKKDWDSICPLIHASNLADSPRESKKYLDVETGLSRK